VINTADESLLRRAIGIAAHAVTLGEAPYGVVYALSTKQLIEIHPQSGDWRAVTQDGPALFDEARAPIDAYYRSC
jgi:hypothetical protein